MPLGEQSKAKLATCHPELQEIIQCAADGVDQGDLAYAGIHDITVLCGFRGEKEQNEAVANGASETPWPRSKHNRQPYSDAVDVSQHPVDWNRRKLETLHAYIAGIAHAKGIDLFDISWDSPHIQRNVP